MGKPVPFCCVGFEMPKIHSLIFATLIALPSATFGQSTLNWLLGDWVIKDMPGVSCEANPIEFALLPDGKTIQLTQSADAPFAVVPTGGVTLTVVSDDGTVIGVQNNRLDRIHLIKPSSDHSSFFVINPDEFDGVDSITVFIRCPDIAPAS
jgi:hypothetical protein